MPAIVTKSYLNTLRRGFRRPAWLSRFWKAEAHARLRTEERRYLSQDDWDDAVQTRPVTNRDTD